MNISVLPEILSFLRDAGPSDTRTIAAGLGRPSNEVSSILRYHMLQGNIRRIRKAGIGRYGKPALWSLPKDKPASETVRHVCATCMNWVPETMECKLTRFQPSPPDGTCSRWECGNRSGFWFRHYA